MFAIYVYTEFIMYAFLLLLRVLFHRLVYSNIQ